MDAYREKSVFANSSLKIWCLRFKSSHIWKYDCLLYNYSQIHISYSNWSKRSWHHVFQIKSTDYQCLWNYIGTAAFANVGYLMADVGATCYEEKSTEHQPKCCYWPMLVNIVSQTLDYACLHIFPKFYLTTKYRQSAMQFDIVFCHKVIALYRNIGISHIDVISFTASVKMQLCWDSLHSCSK